jgi:hypothetical protein
MKLDPDRNAFRAGRNGETGLGGLQDDRLQTQRSLDYLTPVMNSSRQLWRPELRFPVHRLVATEGRNAGAVILSILQSCLAARWSLAPGRTPSGIGVQVTQSNACDPQPNDENRV